jgi:hypothetical protein
MLCSAKSVLRFVDGLLFPKVVMAECGEVLLDASSFLHRELLGVHSLVVCHLLVLGKLRFQNLFFGRLISQ